MDLLFSGAEPGASLWLTSHWHRIPFPRADVHSTRAQRRGSLNKFTLEQFYRKWNCCCPGQPGHLALHAWRCRGSLSLVTGHERLALGAMDPGANPPTALEPWDSARFPDLSGQSRANFGGCEGDGRRKGEVKSPQTRTCRTVRLTCPQVQGSSRSTCSGRHPSSLGFSWLPSCLWCLFQA